MRKSIRAAAICAALTGVLVLGTGGAAMAADNPVSSDTQASDQLVGGTYDGSLDVDEMGLFFNSNEQGAFADFYWQINDFAGKVFRGCSISTSGCGQGVKNNAASAKNNRGSTGRIWYRSNYQGTNDGVAGHTSRNLSYTYNENASFNWS